MNTQPANNNRKVVLTTTFMTLWGIVLVGVMAVLMAAHVTPLPPPTEPKDVIPFEDKRISSGESMGPKADKTNQWTKVHVLVAGCPCSQFIAETLASRVPGGGCRELVVVVGEAKVTWQSPLEQRGFEVQNKKAEQLAEETGIEGGPWLLLVSPERRVVYSGGYDSQRPRPGVVLKDEFILQTALAGKPLPNYPAFGCAATPQLQKKLDPIGLCMTIR